MITTYEPDNSIRKGYLALVKEILHEIKNNWWLTYQLFKRDFWAAYKQSLIGILWIFISPFMNVGAFILLNRSGILSIGELTVPYPLYALLGLAFWQLFSTGLLAGTNALVKAGPMIVKINFSKKSLIFASIGYPLLSFVIQFIFICLLFALYRIPPKGYIILTPLFIIPIILFTLGCSFILSIFGGIVRDVSSVISKVMPIFMVLTPILYSRPHNDLLAVFTKYNIFYYLLAVPRDIILTGSFSHWQGLVIATTIAGLLFLTCLIAFHLTETRVAERI